MKKHTIQLFLFVLGSLLLQSCGMYRQNIMFKTKNEELKAIVSNTTKNYTIKSTDQLSLSVYSNNGELIIDPNFTLMKEIGASGNMGRMIEKPTYLVRTDGTVKLPMLGYVPIAGYTLTQADSILSLKYSDYYIESFASIQLENRRAIVLGGGGEKSGGQLVPLLNENMSLLEVIAIAGGIPNSAKAHNLRLIRGDLNDPQVEVIDLSTISGMKAASMYVQPNDIIYIEPVRKVIVESVRDLSPVLSLLTSLLTLAIILNRN